MTSCCGATWRLSRDAASRTSTHRPPAAAASEIIDGFGRAPGLASGAWSVSPDPLCQLAQDLAVTYARGSLEWAAEHEKERLARIAAEEEKRKED